MPEWSNDDQMYTIQCEHNALICYANGDIFCMVMIDMAGKFVGAVRLDAEDAKKIIAVLSNFTRWKEIEK